MMHDKNFYINDNNFRYKMTDYERDEYNGRCYILEESISLRKEMDGALVRRRISKTVYEDALEKIKKEMKID